jgi:hypothetical protein
MKKVSGFEFRVSRSALLMATGIQESENPKRATRNPKRFLRFDNLTSET